MLLLYDQIGLSFKEKKNIEIFSTTATNMHIIIFLISVYILGQCCSSEFGSVGTPHARDLQ